MSIRMQTNLSLQGKSVIQSDNGPQQTPLRVSASSYANSVPDVLSYSESEKQFVKTAQDSLNQVGYCDVDSVFMEGRAMLEDRAELLTMARSQLGDPNLPHGQSYPRTFGVFLVAGSTILPIARHPFTLDGEAFDLSGINLGQFNPENMGPRWFSSTPEQMVNNKAFCEAVHLAINMNPIPPIAKRGPQLIQVFCQGAEVDRNKPTLQAAPPDHLHQDACYFKLNMLVGRHNVTGGVAHFFPPELANTPFDDTAKSNLTKSVDLREPGQGYAFMDPRHCHYAEQVTLGHEDSIGYRYLMTLTPTPLIPFNGDVSIIDDARLDLRANVSSVFDMHDAAATLTRELLRDLRNRMQSR